MKKTTKDNSAAFKEAVSLLAESKNISEETVVTLLEEAMTRAYIKSLGGGDDADVRCSIDPETGHIDLCQVKRVVKEVEDDYLEIEEEEANANLPKKAKKYQAGDEYVIPAPVEELGKMTANAVKSIFSQKVREAERGVLYEIYKDHIGEMIIGTVDKVDERGVLVDIGKTKVELNRRQMIGEETYRIGDPIKVYLQEVKTAQPKEGEQGKRRGPQIEITRASEGFLKRLFEEEIHEVYDGTIIIKKIAREAGVRSKVAVTSNHEDVDAIGGCIGPNGSRIQKVVGQLGNAKDKEKIDIIEYYEAPGAFMIQALKPAHVLGLSFIEPTEENEPRKAIAVIKDGEASLAIGRKAANVRLASRLTGYSIDIKEESEARENEIDYVPAEEWIAQGDAQKREKFKEAYLAKAREERAKKEEEVSMPAFEPVSQSKPAPVLPPEADNPAAEALKYEKQLEEEKSKEVEPKPLEKKEVKTTVSLDDLEKELESAKEKKSQPVKAKKPRKITEKEVERPEPIAPSEPNKPAMAVYTEEELKKFEEEEEADNYDSYEDEDVDYEEYDDFYDEER